MFAATKNVLVDVLMKWLNGWHITAMPQMEIPGLPLQPLQFTATHGPRSTTADMIGNVGICSGLA
jgi:hypothetical protein